MTLRERLRLSVFALHVSANDHSHEREEQEPKRCPTAHLITRIALFDLSIPFAFTSASADIAAVREYFSVRLAPLFGKTLAFRAVTTIFTDFGTAFVRHHRLT